MYSQMYNKIILRSDAIDAACDGADEWDGGTNSERDKKIKEYINDVPPVDCDGCKWCNKFYNPCDDCVRRYLDLRDYYE